MQHVTQTKGEEAVRLDLLASINPLLWSYSDAVAAASRVSSISAKDPYISAKDPYISAKDPYISAKDPYLSAKAPYLSAKTPHTSTAKEDLWQHVHPAVLARVFCVEPTGLIVGAAAALSPGGGRGGGGGLRGIPAWGGACGACAGGCAGVSGASCAVESDSGFRV